MTPLFLGTTELIIILVLALVLFGGARLAGLGKGVGRSIREFKEEVGHVQDGKDANPETVDAEIVTEEPKSDTDRLRELEAREAELAAREASVRARETES